MNIFSVRHWPLHIGRVSLACTSITAVGQELMSNGVDSDRTLLGCALLLVRQLKVFHAFLLEWAKAIPSTDSIHRSQHFLPKQDVSSSA